MRLPRDLSGHELVRLLKRYDYEVTRQVGSHIRLQSTLRGYPHNVTIPDHRSLRIGTLSAILSDVAAYLDIEREKLGAGTLPKMIRNLVGECESL